MAVAVQPQPKQIVFLLKYRLFLHIIYFWKAKNQGLHIYIDLLIFNPIQPRGLVLEPKKALKIIFLDPQHIICFWKAFLMYFQILPFIVLLKVI